MIFDDVIDLYEHTKREKGHSLYYDTVAFIDEHMKMV